MLRLVNGARMAALAMLTAAMPLAAVACGDDGIAGGTLPPMITTTTSTTVLATTTTTVTFYRVQSGDTLSKIAVRFNVDQAELMAVNGITDPDHVELGQELKIPPPKQVVDTLPPATSSTAAP
jgi:LysM repeat protein